MILQLWRAFLILAHIPCYIVRRGLDAVIGVAIRKHFHDSKFIRKATLSRSICISQGQIVEVFLLVCCPSYKALLVLLQERIHEKMRPWIGKKIAEFLGEEESTLVDFILQSMLKHDSAEKMLELLDPLLDEEAELFVLKMWRMLIFELKRAEQEMVVR